MKRRVRTDNGILYFRNIINSTNCVKCAMKIINEGGDFDVIFQKVYL